ncbi:hypothetical protein JXB01_01315, partial [Candidatus Micrarchaeota archaeon]|nr:hypothetical protein [Candidatus Micrarchaeota archaeon]
VSNLTALYKLYTNAQDEEKVMAENALLTGVKKAASYVRGSKIEELLSALKKDGATELAEKVTEIEKDVYQKAMEYLLSLRKFSSQKGFPKPPKGLPKSEPKRKITV